MKLQPQDSPGLELLSEGNTGTVRRFLSPSMVLFAPFLPPVGLLSVLSTSL